MQGKHIALVGMMGAGKTTVGAELATLLNWRFLDSDAQVYEATGKSVAEMFESEGENAFRDAEAAALKSAIASPEPVIIGVAGGAVLREENRSLLRDNCLVIWLCADVDTLAKRVGDGRGRPLLGNSPRKNLAQILDDRQTLYKQLSHAQVDSTIYTPTELAHVIKTLYEELNQS